MPKQSRLPACDPCRLSKLSCDHSRPVCGRCRRRNQPANCTYRLAPFQRVQKCTTAHNTESTQAATRHYRTGEGLSSPSGAVTPAGPMPKPHLYPNPGYLGSSSYTTLFGHLPPGIELDTDGHENHIQGRSIISQATINEAHVSHGSELIVQLCRFAHVPACVRLVKAWLGTGANLSLAGSFTEQCALSAEFILTDADAGTRVAADISRDLFTHSCRTIVVTPNMTSDEFCSQFSHRNSRWETLCLLFIAVSRATMGCRYSEPPFDSEQQRRSMCRLSMYYADRCLDITRSLDCLNDLQLILQYENFILHTLVDGDHSFESWRKLGDVASSLFALGYHHDVEANGRIPGFLKNLRRAAFDCSYSADKNVSIFLGRPPRISQKFCELQSLGLGSPTVNEWAPDAQLDFMTEARWAAMCAVLKEDVLDLSREERSDDRARKASLIQGRADVQWSSLPTNFRLQGPLKSLDQHPIELDRILGVRLNHLHVLFLLRLGIVSRISEPDSQLNTIAAEMLGLVIEALMLKDRLINSGTSLVWKVAYYGLAAAGVICLSLLQQSPLTDSHGINTPKVLRELGVLVTEVELGTLVYKEDANYALLAGATQTIKNLIDRVSSGKLDQFRSHQPPFVPSAQPLATSNDESWNPWDNNYLQDFETNFWLTLAEHPFLLEDPVQA